MPNLSPHYRSDPIDDVPTDLRKYLDSNFLNTLPNLQRSNPKVLVVFSGGNAVGKTTLAEKIGNELGGLVLENDAVKRWLIQRSPELRNDRDTLNKLTWQYTMNLYPRLTEFTVNGLVVRDAVIDWYFDRILPIFEDMGYSLFIVAYELSHEKSVELIRARGDTPTVSEKRFYRILDDHRIHQERFRKKFVPNLVLTDENLFDHDSVVTQLRSSLKHHTKTL